MAKDRRLKLHAELVELLGNNNVYFQPPESIRLQYPCIIYMRRGGDIQFANNKPYIYEDSYELMYIDRDLDNDMVEKLARQFPKSQAGRSYTADNLNHYPFTIYY